MKKAYCVSCRETRRFVKKSNNCLCCEKCGSVKFYEDKRSKSRSDPSFFDFVSVIPKEAFGVTK